MAVNPYDELVRSFSFANERQLPLRERIARQLWQRQRPYPKTFGEGLAAIGDAIGSYRMQQDLLTSDEEARKKFSEQIAGGPKDDGGGDTSTVGGGGTEVGSRARMPAAGEMPAGEIPRITREGGVDVHEGDYNFMDAQVRDPRQNMLPIAGQRLDAVLDATANPDMQALIGHMSMRERPPGAKMVSPTGAEGNWQFTKQGARAVDLPLSQRMDDFAAARGAARTMEMNRARFIDRFGREPSMRDLAAMYQQGAGGGMGLVQGRPVSPENARVNNLPVGDAAGQRAGIDRYYGLPDRPVDYFTTGQTATAAAPPPAQPRMQLQTGTGQVGAPVAPPVQNVAQNPMDMPSAAGAVFPPGQANVMPPATGPAMGPQMAGNRPVMPDVRGAGLIPGTTAAPAPAAFQRGPAVDPRAQAAATLATRGDTDFSGQSRPAAEVPPPNPTVAAASTPPMPSTTASPPTASGISAPPPGGNRVVVPGAQRAEEAPQIPDLIKPSPREVYLRGIMAANPEYAHLAAPELAGLVQAREYRQARAMEIYKANAERHNKMLERQSALHEKLLEKQLEKQLAQQDPKYQLELDKLRRDLDKREIKEVDGRILEQQSDKTWKDVTPGGGSVQPNLAEPQMKAINSYRRGKLALHSIGDGENLNDVIAWYGSVLPAWTTNWTGLIAPEFREQYTAAEEFASLVLRGETGAGALPSEVASVAKRFFSLPGEPESVRVQKREMRDNVIKSVRSTLGKGTILADNFDKDEFPVMTARMDAAKKAAKADGGATPAKAPTGPLGSEGNPIRVNSDAEAKALPVGTHGILNGRPFRIDP